MLLVLRALRPPLLCPLKPPGLAARVGTGPHLNGPRPWIVEGGPAGAAPIAVAAILAAAATPVGAAGPAPVVGR